MTISESANISAHKSSRERVSAYRKRMREKGLRPVTVWLPDVTSPEFREQISQGCEALKQNTEERDVLDWLSSVHQENEASNFYGPVPDFNQ